MSKSIDQELADSQVAIENALGDKKVLQRLAVLGYDTKKIREGKVLRETTMMLQSVQKKEYGLQYKATDALRAAWEEAEELFAKHVSIARIVFKNNREVWNSLQLAGVRKRVISGWLEQARIFYVNAPEVASQLEAYGVTLAELESGKAMIDAVAAAYARQKQEKGKAQQATRQRDEALAALKAWMSDFMAIARIALKDDVQQLESLGVVVR